MRRDRTREVDFVVEEAGRRELFDLCLEREIGLVGMNEACLNFLGRDITTSAGQSFSVRTMKFLRDLLVDFQKETGHMYNLEATPAEGTTYRFAKEDRKRWPDILQAEQQLVAANASIGVARFPEDGDEAEVLLRKADEADWRCPNRKGCPSQTVEWLCHYGSPDAMDIEHLGFQTVSALAEPSALMPP